MPADSPFASLILKGLSGAADFWKDGFLSAEELAFIFSATCPFMPGARYIRLGAPLLTRRPGLAAGNSCF